jgi:tetratricopeptide (TPR) repeat protein
MKFSLSSRVSRTAVVAVSLALAAGYLYAAGRSFVASQAARSGRTAGLQRAVHLEPLNARYHFASGSQRLMIETDVAGAVEEFRTATTLDPYNSGYWLALARAHLLDGNLEAQEKAIERALAAEPTTPEVAWEAANFFAVRGELGKTLRALRTVIENAPEQTGQAVGLAWRVCGDVERILAEALPPRSYAYMALLRQASNAHANNTADLVWERAQALQQPIAAATVFPYFDALIDAGRVKQARQVWTQLLQRNPALQAYQPGEDRVVNGGFENELLNGGFDWRLAAPPAVKLDLDALTFHRGRQSLAVVFDTTYAAEAGLTQYVAVEPRTRYHFSAFVRAEELVSANGPRLAVNDAFSKARLGVSAETSGTTPWDERAFDFTTGPETTLVVVSAMRESGLTLIRGKFWIDDVAITRKQD